MPGDAHLGEENPMRSRDHPRERIEKLVKASDQARLYW